MSASQNTRTETDSFGPLEVPVSRYWGAQTQRSLMNFPIGWEKQPVAIVRALGVIKKACAMANKASGKLDGTLADAIIAAAEEAVKYNRPLVLFSAAGGARMQEGILSLMQMPRTTVAVEMLKEAGLPYIVVLTHPTTGGVTASYAMLGDVQIAEPNALIGFAGARVIEQTIGEKLPEGFQRSEYLLDHGMLDRVTPRKDMRNELITIIRMLMGLTPQIAGDLPSPEKISVIEPAPEAAEKAADA
jgi:acetyl-CoA carboxylase carboxyl transferase subunit beta